MKKYTTVYTKQVKRRNTGKVEAQHQIYSTQTLTPMHKYLRNKFNGKTYENVKSIYTHFITGGMMLDAPIVVGGKLI